MCEKETVNPTETNLISRHQPSFTAFTPCRDRGNRPIEKERKERKREKRREKREEEKEKERNTLEFRHIPSTVNAFGPSSSR